MRRVSVAGAPRGVVGGARGRRGLTLVELMLVMGLVSIILGMGLGMFATLNPSERIAVGVVQNLARTASNTALARRAPAQLEIDPASGRITARAFKVIGTWRFEDEAQSGAFGLDGVTVGGGRLIEDGFQGKALSFDGEPLGSKWECPVHEDPAWDFEDGFAIDLCLRREEGRAALVLSLGQVVVLRASAQGALEAYFIAKSISETGRESAGNRVWLKSPPGVLRLRRWDRLRLIYDRNLFRMLVDGVEVAALVCDLPVFDIERPLVLAGGSQLGLPGAVDNLVVSAMDGEDTAILPDGVRFTSASARSIRFDGTGGLEPTVHTGPQTIEVEFADGRRETVVVGLQGTVE